MNLHYCEWEGCTHPGTKPISAYKHGVEIRTRYFCDRHYAQGMDMIFLLSAYERLEQAFAMLEHVTDEPPQHVNCRCEMEPIARQPVPEAFYRLATEYPESEEML